MTIFNYNKFLTEQKGRALLSYLPSKVSNKPDFELFGNQLYANYLPRALNELGYMVDYIDWQDTNYDPYAMNYDLFIGHGGYNFKQMAQRINKRFCKTIFFSTGFYWREFNRLEQERFDALYQRRGVRLQPDRQITTDEESALQLADGIITLGNNVTAASYSDFRNVYAIGGMTAQRGQDLAGKDYKAGRKHFLFYSGDGSVHKGLDLLIEAFTGTDLHLHVCISKPDMLSMMGIYPEEELSINYYGNIDIHGSLFEKLTKQCDWVISATCCEGCPSAVLECMAHGLIPILTGNASLTDYSSIKPCKYGAILNQNIMDIRTSINNIADTSIDECRELSKCSQITAQTYYSPAAFSLRLKEAIEAIL